MLSKSQPSRVRVRFVYCHVAHHKYCLVVSNHFSRRTLHQVQTTCEYGSYFGCLGLSSCLILLCKPCQLSFVHAVCGDDKMLEGGAAQRRAGHRGIPTIRGQPENTPDGKIEDLLLPFFSSQCDLKQRICLE